MPSKGLETHTKSTFSHVMWSRAVGNINNRLFFAGRRAQVQFKVTAAEMRRYEAPGPHTYVCTSGILTRHRIINMCRR